MECGGVMPLLTGWLDSPHLRHGREETRLVVERGVKPPHSKTEPRSPPSSA